MITRAQVILAGECARAGLTQDETAGQLGIRRETLWRWRRSGEDVQARLDAAMEAAENARKADPVAYEAHEAEWARACDPDSLDERDRLYFDLVIELNGLGATRRDLMGCVLERARKDAPFALEVLESLDRRHAPPRGSGALEVEVSVGGSGDVASAVARIGLPQEDIADLAAQAARRHRERREAEFAALKASSQKT